MNASTQTQSATEPARILAYHLSHKGEPLTQPEKQLFSLKGKVAGGRAVPEVKSQARAKMSGKRSHGRGLRLIAAFKLLKGLALVALGIGALKLLHKDVAAVIEHWISIFRVDPHNHFMDLLLAKLSILDDRRLKEFSVGTFAYSAIFFTEGIGLALEKRWAEYFTIITTSSLLPLEVYELAKRTSVGRGIALLVNLAVVVYLIFVLRRHPKRH